MPASGQSGTKRARSSDPAEDDDLPAPKKAKAVDPDVVAFDQSILDDILGDLPAIPEAPLGLEHSSPAAAAAALVDDVLGTVPLDNAPDPLVNGAQAALDKPPPNPTAEFDAADVENELAGNVPILGSYVSLFPLGLRAGAQSS